MKKQKLLKGSPLFALARSKARRLGLDAATPNLARLIHEIQGREGYERCFRVRRTCSELGCCWQLSCRAKMIRK